jgi:DNA-binding transcriptional regulator YhcF (GntR family)
VSAKHAEIAAELKVAAAVPGHIKRIATKLGVSVRTVQRVQREMRQNRK